MNTKAIAALAPSAPPPRSDRMTKLIDAVRGWWEVESTDWDQLVTGPTDDAPDADIDLWDDMPAIDSKAVARSSPLFKKFLGVELDVTLIRAGGYKTLDDFIDHLVPLMDEAAKKKNYGLKETK
jgi:hypothetical protein